jgi:hypothetical protein
MGLMTGNLHLPVPEWVEPEWRGLMEACWEPNSGARPTTSDLLKQLRAIHAQALAQEAEEAARQQRQAAAAAAAAAAVQEAAPAAPQQQPQTPFAAVWAQPSAQPEQPQVPALPVVGAMMQQHPQQQLQQEGADATLHVLPATPLGPALGAEVRPVAVTPPAHLPMWLRANSNTSTSSQQQRQQQQLPVAAEPLAEGLLLLQQQQSLPGADLVPLVVPGRLPGLPRLVTPIVSGAGSPCGSNGSLRLSTGSQQQQQQLAHHSQGCAQQQQHHRAAVSSPTYQQLI